MISPSEKKDKIIRSTDLDALSCRLNCNNIGYFNPKDKNIEKIIGTYQRYLQFCHGYTNLSATRTLKSSFNDRKLPIINRGTYLRTELINKIVTEFIDNNEQCQILSLGSGSDTRCFDIVERCPSVKYIEIDFPENAKMKKLAILQDQELSKITNCNIDLVIVENKDHFESLESDLICENYKLFGFDLRLLCEPEKNFKEIDVLKNNIDLNRPTLVISECVLCYLTPQDNLNIIRFWNEQFQNTLMALVIYEPLSLNDPFGKQMSENLISRGINLLTFDEFPTLESKITFLKDACNLRNVKATDMSSIGGYSRNEKSWINETDTNKINKLELIDEVEEIQLLLLHYCLIYCDNGIESFDKINHFFWKLSN